MTGKSEFSAHIEKVLPILRSPVTSDSDARSVLLSLMNVAYSTGRVDVLSEPDVAGGPQ